MSGKYTTGYKQDMALLKTAPQRWVAVALAVGALAVPFILGHMDLHLIYGHIDRLVSIRCRIRQANRQRTCGHWVNVNGIAGPFAPAPASAGDDAARTCSNHTEEE